MTYHKIEHCSNNDCIENNFGKCKLEKSLCGHFISKRTEKEEKQIYG